MPDKITLSLTKEEIYEINGALLRAAKVMDEKAKAFKTKENRALQSVAEQDAAWFRMLSMRFNMTGMTNKKGG